jgi:hypothetical protein
MYAEYRQLPIQLQIYEPYHQEEVEIELQHSSMNTKDDFCLRIVIQTLHQLPERIYEDSFVGFHVVAFSNQANIPIPRSLFQGKLCFEVFIPPVATTLFLSSSSAVYLLPLPYSRPTYT